MSTFATYSLKISFAALGDVAEMWTVKTASQSNA
jgi:hypothetical protein